jgi:hypothetical protein
MYIYDLNTLNISISRQVASHDALIMIYLLPWPTYKNSYFYFSLKILHFKGVH